MSGVQLDEFLGAFLVEAEEHLATASSSLLAIEAALAEGGSAPKRVRDLYRALHTLKGLAAMVGVEPIVATAHRMEAVVRVADRTGADLAAPAIDALIRGVQAIERCLRALGDRSTPPPPAPALLEALDGATSSIHAVDRTTMVPLTLAPTIAAKLTASERRQIDEGLAAGLRAMRVDFRPSAAHAAAGANINSVREALAALGEIVRVVPEHVAATDDAPAGILFVVVLLTSASDEAIRKAGPLDRVDDLAPSAEPTPVAPLPDEIASPTIERGGPARLRVEVSRIDDAMEHLATLIVTRSRLARAVASLAEAGVSTRDLSQIMADQSRQLRDLRAAILRVRMVPMHEVLDRLPLLVRGVCRSSGKRVRLSIDVGGTELDKSVADRIFPTLVHLVRNAVDHGIEAPADRERAGKPAAGSLTITCHERSSTRLEIVITDDGAGVNRAAVALAAGAPLPADDAALLDLLCRPGLSTRAAAPTETSGRGMGMDIVRRVIVDELGGELELQTRPGEGTTFVVRVPLTVSIVDAFTLECSGERFVVPVAMVEELVEIDASKVVYGPIAVTGAERRGVGMLQRRGEAVPLVELATALRLERPKERAKKAVIVRRAREPMAFGLDRIVGQQEAVVRPIDDPLVRVPGVAGATDLGDGRPTLVLDLVTLSASLATRGGGGEA